MVVKMILLRSFILILLPSYLHFQGSILPNHISNEKLDILTSLAHSSFSFSRTNNVSQTQPALVASDWLAFFSVFNVRFWMYSFIGYSSIYDNCDYDLIYLMGTIFDTIFYVDRHFMNILFKSHVLLSLNAYHFNVLPIISLTTMPII